MTDCTRLAKAVAADPLNVELRLVFADALEEASDSEQAIHQRELAQRVALWAVAAAAYGKRLQSVMDRRAAALVFESAEV